MRRECLSLFKVVTMGILLTLQAMSPARATSGRVQFGGMIVEDGCQVRVINNQLQSECYRNGKTQKVIRSVEQAQYAPMMLPAQVGESRLAWANDSRTQALITVSYR